MENRVVKTAIPHLNVLLDISGNGDDYLKITNLPKPFLKKSSMLPLL